MRRQRYHVRWQERQTKEWTRWRVKVKWDEPRPVEELAEEIARKVRWRGYDAVEMVECNDERCELCVKAGASMGVWHEQGDIVIETYGEHSDFGIMRILRVLRRFPPEQFKDPQEAIDAGYMEEVPHREWWVG